LRGATGLVPLAALFVVSGEEGIAVSAAARLFRLTKPDPAHVLLQVLRWGAEAAALVCLWIPPNRPPPSRTATQRQQYTGSSRIFDRHEREPLKNRVHKARYAVK
jgi:hypothetical protein